MPIIDTTKINPPLYSNRNDALWQSIIQTFREALSNQEITFVDDGLYTIPGTTSVYSPESAGRQDPAVQHVAGQLGYQTRQFSTQEPQASIYIKKKMFSTLSSQFDLKFMGEDEKFFLRATKRLFSIKAGEIAAYERLMKFKNYLNEGIALVNDAEWMMGQLRDWMTSSDAEQDVLKGMRTKIRGANIEDDESTHTKWVIGIDEIDNYDIGLGKGVIELTCFTNFSTSMSIEEPGSIGTCNLTIEDPYHILFIKVEDIDKAMIQTMPVITSGPSKESFDKAQKIEQEFEQEFGTPITIEFDLSTGKVSTPSYDIEKIKGHDKRIRALAKSEDLVFALEEYIQGASRYVDDLAERNKNVNYVRNKMLKFYSGKAIIQPMDSIHIFINSNTSLQSYSEAERTIQNSSLDVHDIRVNADKEMVLDLYGKDISQMSIMEYRALRRSDAFYGTQIFCGVVDSVNDAYSEGKYTISVKASDNLKWLTISRINQSPSLVQQHGILEDPLTPFIIVPDADGFVSDSTLELLPENRKLFNSNVVAVKGGQYDGVILTSESFIKNGFDLSRLKTAFSMRHAPGLKYRWKEGIFTASQMFSTRFMGMNYDNRDDAQRHYGITLTSSPFDNLDAANIISILVTGYPYNYERFLKNAMNAGNINISTALGGDDYFSILFDAIRVQNKVLGNFVPYVTISSSGIQDLKKNLLIDSKINDSKSKRRMSELKKAKIDEQINELSERTEDVTRALVETLKAESKRLEEEIEELKKIEQGMDENKDSAASPTTEPCEYNIFGSSEEEQATKRKLDYYIFKRRSDVKYNRDKNLFIVSDEYDKNTDIQAFALALKNQNPELYETQSIYSKPIDICQQVAKTLEFEFFADANGNIQFRPPQYNKTPYSILKQMFEYGRMEKKTYPPFMERLFDTRLKMINDRISETEMLFDYKMALLRSASVDNINTILNDDNFPQLYKPKEEITDEFIKSFTKNNILKIQLQQEIEDLESELRMLDNYVKRVTEEKINSKKGFSKEFDGSGGKLVAELSLNPMNYHLVEFDNINEIGYGSGRRFIINDDVIINYNFSESDQGIITRVDVEGRMDIAGKGFGEFAMPQDLWAGGTDFDLWQQYGYRAGAVQKPFFSDVEYQCRPYAAFLLARQRKNIIKGSVTVVGNEYYQLGDVVYITDRELLYYVTGINHVFDYNGTFTTNLELRYGHVPGDYIPTPLDIIGKMIDSQRRKELNFTRECSISERGERLIGVVTFFKVPNDKEDPDSKQPKDLVLSFRDNMDTLIRAYYIAKNYIKSDNEVIMTLRAFYNEGDSNGKETAVEHVSRIGDWFIRGPVDKDGNPIAILEDCSINKVEERIEMQVVNYFGNNSNASEEEDSGGGSDVDSENDLILSPVEETLSLVSSGSEEIHDIVEIILDFESKSVREKNSTKYKNFIDILKTLEGGASLQETSR